MDLTFQRGGERVVIDIALSHYCRTRGNYIQSLESANSESEQGMCHSGDEDMEAGL
jgi:hypothetical protein